MKQLCQVALSVANKWPTMPSVIRAYLETGEGQGEALKALRVARKTLRGPARAAMFAAWVAVKRRDRHALEDVRSYAESAGRP